MSTKIPARADVDRAAAKLRKHCPIDDVIPTSADYWEVEYVATVETEYESRGADGPYMREFTERVESSADGEDLEDLVDLLREIRDEGELEYVAVHLPAYLVDELL